MFLIIGAFLRLLTLALISMVLLSSSLNSCSSSVRLSFALNEPLVLYCFIQLLNADGVKSYSLIISLLDFPLLYKLTTCINVKIKVTDKNDEVLYFSYDKENKNVVYEEVLKELDRAIEM